MLTTLISGLAIGSVYALVAFGYNFVWTTTRAINFAQGGFVVAGMFLTIYLNNLGVPWILIFVILAATGAVAGAIVFTVAVLPVLKFGDHAELVTTVGVMTVIQGVLLLLVTQDVLKVPFFGPDWYLELQGARVSAYEFVIIGVAVVVGVAAHLWTVRTKRGLAAQALSEDPEAATLVGVNSMRFSYAMFILSGVLGLLIAPIIGPKTFAVVGLAAILAIKGIIALAVGGLGSQLGALLAGLVIGVVELFVARIFSATWQNIAVYLLFVILILIRPRGFFGQRNERVV